MVGWECIGETGSELLPEKNPNHFAPGQKGTKQLVLQPGQLGGEQLGGHSLGSLRVNLILDVLHPADMPQ